MVTANQITRYNNQKDRNLNFHCYEHNEAHIFRQRAPSLHTTSFIVIKYKQFQNFQGKTMKIQNYPKHSTWLTSCIRDNLKMVRIAVIVRKFFDLYMFTTMFTKAFHPFLSLAKQIQPISSHPMYLIWRVLRKWCLHIYIFTPRQRTETKQNTNYCAEYDLIPRTHYFSS